MPFQVVPDVVHSPSASAQSRRQRPGCLRPMELAQSCKLPKFRKCGARDAVRNGERLVLGLSKTVRPVSCACNRKTLLQLRSGHGIATHSNDCLLNFSELRHGTSGFVLSRERLPFVDPSLAFRELLSCNAQLTLAVFDWTLPCLRLAHSKRLFVCPWLWPVLIQSHQISKGVSFSSPIVPSGWFDHEP